ncbi:MAG: bacteriohemerythrin [Lachnospiraceae bacterium]
MRAVFDDSLITGNEMIDSQHKELIEKINRLMESVELGNDQQVALKTLDYLMDYTQFHFGAEEKLQEEIGYPALAEHKKEHAKLVQVVNDLHELLEEDGVTQNFADRVNENVIEWLYTHIKGFDRSVAEYRFLRDNSYLL